MREQRDRADWPVRPVEQCGKLFTLSIDEIEALGRHDD
jgi:hypothetical protein